MKQNTWTNKDNPVWIFAVLFVLQLVVFWDAVIHYQPTGEDIALIVHSTPHAGPLDVGEWWQQGFAGYFTAYPEWTSNVTPFVHPIVNLVYYVQYRVFEDYWGLYLLFGFFVNAVGAAMAFVLSRRFFQSGFTPSVLAALIFAAIATSSSFPTHPCLAFEPLAAVLALAGFLALAQELAALSLLLLTLAVLTSEAVLFAPLATGIGYLILVYSHRKPGERVSKEVRLGILVALLPVSAWICVHWLRVGPPGDLYQAYGIDTVRDALAQLLSGALVWPLGHDISQVRDALARVFAGTKDGIRPGDVGRLLFVVTNVGFVLFFVSALVRALVVRSSGPGSSRARVGLVWLGLSIAELALLGLEKRFGYSFFLFGVPFLVRLIETSDWRPLRLGGIAYLVVATMLGVSDFQQQPGDAARRSQYSRAQDLVHVLRTVSVLKSRPREVYLVNDLVGGVAAGSLRQFAHRATPASLTILASGIEAPPQFEKRDGALTVTLATSDGSPIAFPGVDIDCMLTAIEPREKGLLIRRNDHITYFFPEATIELAAAGRSSSIGFGSRVVIRVEDLEGIFVFYDATTGMHHIELPWTH